jgi:hypothetical protein
MVIDTIADDCWLAIITYRGATNPISVGGAVGFPDRSRDRDICQNRRIKSAALNAPTDIAVTFVDYFDPKNRDVQRFDPLTAETQMLIEEAERVASAPVSLVSVGVSHRAVLDRRSW